MALSVADSRTILSTEDGTSGNWDEATTSDYVTADDGGREGTGFVGYDVDIETNHNFDTGTTIPLDMSGNHHGRWMRITNAGSVDSKANGGIRLCLRDGSGNESYWYVGGSDTYSGGWAYFVVNLDSTPNANNGSDAVVTDAVDFGVGFKMLAKSLDDNCQMDLAHYGTGGLVVTGTPDTGTYGTDKAMQELFDVINAGNYGLLDKQAGIFVGKGPIQFNDDSSGTCTFEDAGSTLAWADFPVSATFYKFTLGSSSGVTTIRFGTVVGSGDGRQGVNGGSIFDAGSAGWSIDFDTNLTGNASNDVKIYGIGLNGATTGLKFNDSVKTSIISVSIVSCGEVDLGTTNDGAEMLNFAIIDPLGATNNYGLVFNQTPSAGTLSHNVKQGSFITSGSPTTQYMLRFPYAGDYSITLTDFVFYGDYSSGTLWHGLNSGSNADLTINNDGSTNAVQSEFSNTAGGTVTVVAGAVTITVNATDTAGDDIENANVLLKASDGTGPFPYQETVTITRSGTTATVAHTGHGMANNDKVDFKGITDKTEDNNVKQITVINVNSYSFTTTDSGSTSYTGTIKATFVALQGLTNVSGIISTSRTYSSNQPVSGWARKSSASPYYKQAGMSGIIDSSTGYSAAPQLVSD